MSTTIPGAASAVPASTTASPPPPREVPRGQRPEDEHLGPVASLGYGLQHKED